jgi:hypothetical protein
MLSHLAWKFTTVLALAVLSTPPGAAQIWHPDASGRLVGIAPKTSAELLDFCVANPAHCSISVNHLSGGWQRHLRADRLNPVASTYKLVILLDYAERVADGRIQGTQRVSREHWTRNWIGADGEELRRARAGPIVDEAGGTYQIRRIHGRRMDGSLRQAWEFLRRPRRVTVSNLAEMMIRFSDNAAADWFLYEFGERSFERVIDRLPIGGYHDVPPSIHAMFLTYFLNPDWLGRPAIGEQMLSNYGGYEARGYQDEMARWFARLESRDYVARARSCQPAVLPWDQRIGLCPPSVGEPGEEQMRTLFNRFSVQSNTRTQTRLMARLLGRDLMDPEAHGVAEEALEFRLDPSRYRDPRFRDVFRRYGAKSGSFRTNRGWSVLAWTAYFESQPGGDGATRKGAVSVHLRDLPGRQRHTNGGYSTGDIDFELPLRFAEDVILDRDGLGTALMNRVPEVDARPELVARVRRLETHSSGTDAESALSMLVRIKNIGPAPTDIATEAVLFTRAAAGAPSNAALERADQIHAVPRLAPGESIDLPFNVSVPKGRDFVALMIDPRNLVSESTEEDRDGADNNVQWERLRFPSVNYRSIGTRRGHLDAGDGVLRSAFGDAESATIRFEGAGELAENVGRGDRLTLNAGGAHDVIGYVASRDGPTRLTLQQPLSAPFSGVSFTIQRAFHDIQSWENAREGDLVADARVEVGVLFDDGPFRCRPVADSGCRFDGARAMAMATIDGSVTNAAHYMALQAADGQRHRGVAGSGVVLDGENAVQFGIRVLDHYTRISGLALRRFAGRRGTAAVSVERARHVLLDDLFIHDFHGAEGPAAGILGGHFGDFVLRNSTFRDGGTGVRIDRPTASALVENCTVSGMSGVGILEGDGLLNVRNTVSVGSGERDFQVRRGAREHNLSSDDSALGPGSTMRRAPAGTLPSMGAHQ